MRKTQFIVSAFFSFALLSSSLAQSLSIGSIDKNYTPFGTTITIRGNGFSSDASNMVVKFGASKSQILSATETLIEAVVPSGATIESISVTNLSTGRTGYSKERFTLSFGGDAFDASRFIVPIEESSGEEPFDIDLHDFDLDGKNDILITKVASLAKDIAIAQNTSTGPSAISFKILNSSTNPELSIGNPTQFADIGDIDSDGKSDIVLTVDNENSNQLYFLKNISTPGSIKFGSAFSRFVGNEHRLGAVRIKDINDDGLPDVVAANTFANGEISAFLNNGSTTNMGISSTETFIKMPDGTNSFDIYLEDLNGDGKPEIIVNQRVANNIFVLTNKSSGGTLRFDDPITLDNAQGNLTLMEIADLNKDGLNDIIVSRSVVQEDILILLNTTPNDGRISFSVPQQFKPEGRPIGIGIGDLDGNQTIDIVTSSSTNNLGVLVNGTTAPDNTNFTQAAIASTTPSRIIKIGDVNLDAKPDVIHTIVDPGTGKFGVAVLINDHCLKPEISPEGPLTICNSQTKRLFATPSANTEFVWEESGLEVKRSNDPFIDITTPGTYTVTAIIGGCAESSAAVLVESRTADVPTTPVISDQNFACEGNDVTLTASAATGASYMWTGPGGYTSSEPSPLLSSINQSNAGKYFLTIELNDCVSDPDSTVIEVISPPVTEITAEGPTTFCEGDQVTLSISDFANYDYQWFLGADPISGANSFSYDATTAGIYSVALSSTVATCEVTSSATTVSTVKPPVAEFEAATSICSSIETPFTNNSTIDQTQTVSYSWNFGDLSTSTEENPLHTYASAGIYNVELTVAYDIGCSDVITKAVIVDQSVPFTIQASGDVEFCEGGTVSLSVPDNGYASITWSDGSTSQTIDVNTTGTYSAEAVNSSGCISTDEQIVTVFENPTITVDPANPSIGKGEEIELVASGAVTYEWSPAQGLSSTTIANPIANPDTTTNYTVTGIDINGCSGMVELTLTVVNTPGLDAPVAFSPNNDGINDLWVVRGLDTCPDCTMMIFNRQGNKVFEAAPYLNDWDATMNGSVLPEGAYYYVWSGNNTTPFSGSVTVIR